MNPREFNHRQGHRHGLVTCRATSSQLKSLLGGRQWLNETSTDFDSLLQFDIDNKRWNKIGKLSRRRYNHAVTVVDASDINCENNNELP